MKPDALRAGDPTAATDHHLPDNRFIPVRFCDLVDALAADAARFGMTPDELRAVAVAIGDAVEHEALALERALCDAYVPFNPDRDTLPPADLDQRRADAAYDAVYERLEHLLEKANFMRLSNVQLEAAVKAARYYGVKVRLNPLRIQHLSVWVRGRSTIQQRRLTLRHPRAGVLQNLDVYNRLVFFGRLRDDPHVLLKLFKDIPVVDVEALLPHAEVAMSWLDRILLMGGGAGMAGSATAKTLQLLAGLAYWSRILWVVLIGGLVMAFRTITGYRSSRQRRDFQRTRHLYYQNLDNNQGVIHALVSMVAQEEAKEALLAWAFCQPRGAAKDDGDGPIADEADLGRRVRAYLLERFRATVEFDVSDAVRTMERLGLWMDRKGLAAAAAKNACGRLRVGGSGEGG